MASNHSNASPWSRFEAQSIAAVVVLLIALSLNGCGGSTWLSWIGIGDHNPPSQPMLVEPETPQQKVDRLTGELATAKSQRDEAQLAPIRTTLLWCEGLSVLIMLAGVGLAVAARVWGLGIGVRPALGIAALGAAVLGMCLVTGWAINHWHLIVGCLIAAGALAALVYWNTHRSLSGIGRAGLSFGEQAVAELGLRDPARAASLKAEHAGQQLRSGVQHLVDRARAVVNRKA